MKKMMFVLLMSLSGSFAQALPWESPVDFGHTMCSEAEDYSNCDKYMDENPYVPAMNYYAIAMHACSDFGTNDIKKATCYGRAATKMRDAEFKEDINDCVNETKFWSNDRKRSWAQADKIVACQREKFAARSERLERDLARGGTRRGGVRN